MILYVHSVNMNAVIEPNIKINSVNPHDRGAGTLQYLQYLHFTLLYSDCLYMSFIYKTFVCTLETSRHQFLNYCTVVCLNNHLKMIQMIVKMRLRLLSLHSENALIELNGAVSAMLKCLVCR